MTLSTIVPSMRRFSPDPFSVDQWPANTVARTGDVVIAAVSLHRLVELCGTPCVHTAPAVIPGSDGRPSADETVSVIVAAVTVVTSRSGNRLAYLDADLSCANALTSEARLIGRVSTAHAAPWLLVPGNGTASLPGDLASGDLLAIPCLGTASLRDIRPDNAEPIGRCGR